MSARGHQLLWALSITVASAVMLVSAQQPAPRGAASSPPAPVSSDPEPTARIVRLDAVVVDAKGRPVLDLHALADVHRLS